MRQSVAIKYILKSDGIKVKVSVGKGNIPGEGGGLALGWGIVHRLTDD